MENQEINVDYLKIQQETIQKASDRGLSVYDIGLAVNELSMAAARNNLVVGILERNYRRRKAAVYREMDPNTGKAITASKADVMAEDSDEWHSWDMARRHYENNRDAEISLKSLIKAASERGDDTYVNPTKRF